MLRGALAVWSALPLVVLGAAGLTVDSLSPDALCPPLEETRAVVAARLGSVELEGTWHASYLLVHRKQGDFVSLSLRDPDGVLRLQRDLPVQGGSCATLSRVIALVLERFFLRPEQATAADPAALVLEPPKEPVSAPSLSASASEPARSEPPPPPAPKPTPEQTDVTAAPVAGKPRHYRLSAALWASTSWVAPSLGLARDIGGRYELALNAGFDLTEHEARAFDGSVTLRRAPLALDCGREFELGSAARASARLELLGVIEEAETTALAESGGGLRVVPGLGARIGARFFTSSAAQPFADLTAAWLLRAATPEFQVGTREVLAPSALVFGLALGIATPF
jgi:hypothetical protein